MGTATGVGEGKACQGYAEWWVETCFYNIDADGNGGRWKGVIKKEN